jgi:hypothetical protein
MFNWKPFVAEGLRRQLKQSCEQSEETSDKIAESFLSGDMPVEEFIKVFRDTRRTFYLKSLKLERMPPIPNVADK